ncbi:hypothetical protein P170DRAFT_513855 [Aspergillus steynii IBT 23096]|uniref:Uncharacterized protein n=1 Tax=Aspergillus steynii IBT 23096 TaxID=1392250 RepID=A0A2I2FS81_9EURO|nr:uncharacterized protein P170DRAFT_513855 [Aspergillus steynii IBT 23096]PLB43490.1 hypothetical protein P170DRAFT_513855 [Aspergillus steynii IBT 23096]
MADSNHPIALTPETSETGVFVYYVHFPLGGLMQADHSKDELLDMLRQDLRNQSLTLYRTESDCPASGVVLKVRVEYEDEAEVLRTAQEAVDSEMENSGIAVSPVRTESEESDSAAEAQLQNEMAAAVATAAASGNSAFLAAEGNMRLEILAAVAVTVAGAGDVAGPDAASPVARYVNLPENENLRMEILESVAAAIADARDNAAGAGAGNGGAGTLGDGSPGGRPLRLIEDENGDLEVISDSSGHEEHTGEQPVTMIRIDDNGNLEMFSVPVSDIGRYMNRITVVEHENGEMEVVSNPSDSDN